MKRSFQIAFSTLFILLGTRLSAMVTEVPFIELPTGQVVVQAQITGVEGKHYFIVELAGDNAIRSDMNYRLANIGIDTLTKRLEFDNIQVGEMNFTNYNKFRVKSRLSKRSEYAFPPTVLGTLGAVFFNKKAIQFNFNTHILRIADSIDELSISDNAEKIPFTRSFTNNIPVIEANSNDFGTQEIYVDPSLPVGINFTWSLVPASVRSKYKGSFKSYETSLDGENKVKFATHQIEGVYLNRHLEIIEIEATFSDDIIPAIGNIFLRNFITTLDLDHGNIYFEANTEIGKTLLKPSEKKNKKKK